jgi:hypothetical protein
MERLFSLILSMRKPLMRRNMNVEGHLAREVVHWDLKPRSSDSTVEASWAASEPPSVKGQQAADCGTQGPNEQ